MEVVRVRTSAVWQRHHARCLETNLTRGSLPLRFNQEALPKPIRHKYGLHLRMRITQHRLDEGPVASIIELGTPNSLGIARVIALYKPPVINRLPIATHDVKRYVNVSPTLV